MKRSNLGLVYVAIMLIGALLVAAPFESLAPSVNVAAVATVGGDTLTVSQIHWIENDMDREFWESEELHVFHVDQFTVTAAGILLLDGEAVFVDPSVNIEELIYLKEEISVRLSDGEAAIISGDNGQF